jgi:hypothetical protein
VNSVYRYIKPGDWLTMFLGCLVVLLLVLVSWNGAMADKVVIRSQGKLFREVPLSRNQRIAVPGSMGISLVAIENRKVRIASDPGPRQYCVRQGWLKQAGEIALCLPNQVSVELVGSHRRYDSLSY